MEDTKEKRFVGLDGLKRFWTKAKTWIAEQITSEVTARIAELVANAPEDLDTLKEIADWISAHADDAAAMNTQITTNKNEISSLKTTVAGKANSSHTHTKSQITDFPTSLPANGGTADRANKIDPNHTGLQLTTVSLPTAKYVKLADCYWDQGGTLEVHLSGDGFYDTIIINYGGGNACFPMLCGYYTSNSNNVYSVIAKRGSSWSGYYSIWIKIIQYSTCYVSVGIIRGDCTINISETTTAPTDIYDWAIDRGYWGTFTGNITTPNITVLENRVAALESKIK